jgi:hypothetical protein
VGTFGCKDIETWERKKLQALKKPINETEMVVFFYRQGHMHWILFTTFQDLEIIEEFNSLESSSAGKEIRKRLYHCLFVKCNSIGIQLDPMNGYCIQSMILLQDSVMIMTVVFISSFTRFMHRIPTQHE